MGRPRVVRRLRLILWEDIERMFPADADETPHTSRSNVAMEPKPPSFEARGEGSVARCERWHEARQGGVKRLHDLLNRVLDDFLA